MIGVITEQNNDVTALLKANNILFKIIEPHSKEIINEYQSLLILGGTKSKPLTLNMNMRTKIENYIKTGKKVFVEFVSGMGAISIEEVLLSRYERVAYVSDASVTGLDLRDILDNQCTYRIKPFHDILKSRKPIMVFSKEHTHCQLESIADEYEVGSYALFFEKSNVLFSSFQLANFNRNRYTPITKVNALVKWILEWVSDKSIDMDSIKPSYHFERNGKSIKESASHIKDWYCLSGTLLDNGKSGVQEGFSTEINDKGTQARASNVRADCVGESALFYYLYGKAYDDTESLEISNNLIKFLNEYFIIQEGDHSGFVRWSNASYESSYGDDAARMLLGPLFKNLMGDGTQEELESIIKVCDHIVLTCGKDGTRPSRLELEELTAKNIQEIQKGENHSNSAHYSAYTYAVLLLTYLLSNDLRYLEIGKKGIEHLMSIYPNTTREQSQTQEEARLIFPLAVISFLTQEKKYLEFLNQVVADLQLRQDLSGSYKEWDEGYKAKMRNTDGDGECSLLSKNGDSVVDLLYSNNWLPLGFAFAYLATNDKKHLEKFNSISKFLMGIQMVSNQVELNGAWARGYDPHYDEYFGSPADMGWGPYAIESGWTVAQIGAGMIFGSKIAEFGKQFKKRRQKL